VQQAGQQVVQQAKPALQHAGETIKETSNAILDKIGGGGGKGGEGSGGGPPPHTV
jgi:hypothetical protein